MSKHGAPVSLALEWSPRGVIACDQGRSQFYPAGVSLPFGGREAVIAVSRRAVFVRRTRVPNASPEEIRTILAMQAEDLFPIGVQDLAIDFLLTDDIQSEGRLAVAVAMPTVELRRLKEQMSTAGVKIRQILPVAFGSALLAQDLHMTDAAVVEQTEEGLAIDLVSKGQLVYSRSAPVGSSIDAEVARTCAAAGIGCLPVVMVGSTSYLEAAVVAQTSPLAALTTAPVDRFVHLEETEVLLARKKATNDRRMLWAGLSLVASLGVASWVYLDYKDAAGIVDGRKSRYSAGLRKYQALQKESETNVNRLTEVERELKLAFEPAQRFSDVITVLTNRAPEGVWLTGLSVERGKVLSVRGTSRTSDLVTAYLKNLSSEPRFRDVRLVFANNGTIETQAIVQFSITLFPNGNVPLIDPTKKEAKKR